MNIILSQCFDGKNYNRYDNEKHSCRAFLKGIPDRILYNKIKHKRKLRGQEGNYIYEPKNEDQAIN